MAVQSPNPSGLGLPYDPFGLRNIEQEPADNIGGLEAVWYTLASNFRSWPAAGELLIRQDLDLVPGAVWYQLVSTRYTVRHKQTPKALGRHGDIYQQQLQGVLPRHTAGLAAGLETLQGQRLVFLTRDRNGEVQLVGTPDQPLLYSDTFDSGAEAFGQRNNYDWRAAGDTVRRARPYLGSWLVSDRGLEHAVQLGTGAGGLVEVRDLAGNLMATVPAGKTVIVRSGFRVAFTIE
ncbi:hypothetical protein [Hymenobacter sp. B81]|uniref:hypothetical protein n=1 Tax=Hymenobacter sp. B81 TaxID=3344878 RepID=UPI0037DDE1A0